MTIQLSFVEEMESIEAQLAQAEQELRQLEDRYEHFATQTKSLRDSLKRLRATEQGKYVVTTRSRSSKLQPLEVNPETNRPSRGERRKQVYQVCKLLGRAGKEFRTIDVLNELCVVEGELSAGMKSYTYAVLTTLGDEGVLEKINRGTWKLRS